MSIPLPASCCRHMEIEIGKREARVGCFCRLVAFSAFFGLVNTAAATDEPWRDSGQPASSRAQRIWLEQIAERLSASGFEVRRMEPEDGGYTIEMIYRGPPARERTPNQ